MTVPLIPAGMILHLTGPFFLEEWVWYLTDRALAALFYLLNALPQGWVNIDNRWQWLTLLPANAYRVAIKRLAYLAGGLFMRVIVDELATLAADKRQRMAGAYAGCRSGAGDSDRQGR